MRRNAKPRIPKSRWDRCFLVFLSLYLLYTWFSYRNVRIGVDGITQQESPRDLFVSPLDHHSNQDFCDDMNASSVDGGIIQQSVFRRWEYIDDTIKRDFPKARVSGGIFLYPRQASILTHLIQRTHAALRDDKKTITICETGYGSGHSMALFQEASRSIGPVRIISFDKFDRPYQLPIWHHLNKTMSATHSGESHDEFVKGNSCKTVPNRLPSFRCDVLHGSSLCPSDNIDLVENSPCGVLLTSTAMNSLNDRQVYFGPHAQWRKLRERNCISNIVCFREDGILDLKRDFIFAKQGSTQTGEFCVAVTTGRCQRGKANAGIMSQKCLLNVNQLLGQLDLNKTCPKHQIEIPL